jgi:hypothetical protein
VGTFSPGEVFRRTVEVLRSHFVAFALLTLAIQLPTIVLVGLHPGADDSRFLSLLDNLLGFVVTGALTSGVLRALEGERPTLGAMARLGLARTWRVFGATFLASLAVLLGLVALVVPGLFIASAVAVAVPVAVAEERGATDAISRSFELTKGSRLRVLGIGIALAVYFVAAAAGIVTTMSAGAELAGLPAGPLAAIQQALLDLVWIVVSVALAITYHALKVQKEGVTVTQVATVFE